MYGKGLHLFEMNVFFNNMNALTFDQVLASLLNKTWIFLKKNQKNKLPTPFEQ